MGVDVIRGESGDMKELAFTSRTAYDSRCCCPGRRRPRSSCVWTTSSSARRGSAVELRWCRGGHAAAAGGASVVRFGWGLTKAGGLAAVCGLLAWSQDCEPSYRLAACAARCSVMPGSTRALLPAWIGLQRTRGHERAASFTRGAGCTPPTLAVGHNALETPTSGGQSCMYVGLGLLCARVDGVEGCNSLRA